ncbi:hypothetical protein GTR02_15190 [Kineococcus sp. R8]|uniref:DoxX family protein n=1 Tax=Kineococcus siccus TaxID=2696567 RepID=UPI0014137825|nr:hypothetical protein [Kineococcus siccus]NAZ83164.1 hypothetical protein [Kineococcus siccus]
MASSAVSGRPATAGRWVPLTVLLGVAGAGHFLRPSPFDAVVPRALPGDARTWTLVSGVAELGLAAGLAVPATRRAAGWATAAFFVGVWPANGQQALDAWRRRARSPRHARACALALARLPLQVPLVVAALRVARP